MLGIDDVSRYYAPVRHNFANAAMRKRKAWFDADQSRNAVIDFLLTNMSGNGFYESLWNAYQEYGTLTVKQEAALRKSMSERAERKASYAAKFAAENASSVAVGEVGKRQVFELTVTFTKMLDTYHMTSMKDAEGNVFMYFGNFLAAAGETVKVKATVKRHQEYAGVMQTVISRPALM